MKARIDEFPLNYRWDYPCDECGEIIRAGATLWVREIHTLRSTLVGRYHPRCFAPFRANRWPLAAKPELDPSEAKTQIKELIAERSHGRH